MTALFSNLADGFRRWKLTRRTINSLERLDDRLLDDAGLDRYTIASVAARQARARVARDRATRDRKALERAEQRELARQRAVLQSPRFALALDHVSPWHNQPNRSRIPSVIDDIALGAAFRGEPCHGC